MNMYTFGDIKICIGATVTAFHMHGETIKPHKSRLVQDFWNNNYFRRHTKSYLSVKAAEVVCRSIGLHTIYLLLQEHKSYILFYLPIFFQYIRSIDLPDLILCIDAGFVAGIITTCVLNRLRSRVSDFFYKRG